jgi:D-serine deaminase-like pyridoxal phosphate-dependent protein
MKRPSGLDYKGLVGWEGHVMFFGEAERIAREAESAMGGLLRSAEMCRQSGLPVEIVSAGGTVSYRTTGRLPGVTEIQLGGGVLMDAFYQKRGVSLEPYTAGSTVLGMVVVGVPRDEINPDDVLIASADSSSCPLGSLAPVCRWVPLA